jgi:hypothetical protein
MSKSRPFVLAKPVAVGPVVDEDVFVEEVLVFTDDVELVVEVVFTDDVELVVEIVVTADDVFDVVVRAEVVVPGTH